MGKTAIEHPRVPFSNASQREAARQYYLHYFVHGARISCVGLAHPRVNIMMYFVNTSHVKQNIGYGLTSWNSANFSHAEKIQKY